MLLSAAPIALLGETPKADLGVFEQSDDVGRITLKGSATYLPETHQYRLTGSGQDMWAAEDDFQFLWRKVPGDFTLQMDAAWESAGGEKHRKICIMARQSLDADSPYLDVAVHGDGLIEMQYRVEKGGTTLTASTPISAPATVKLERDGDVFTASVSKDGGPFQPIGAWSLVLPNPALVGLGICSHSDKHLAAAVISNLNLISRPAPEGGKRVRETTLETLLLETGERHIVYRDQTKFEAPNWSRDGNQFIINRDGYLWTLPVTGGQSVRLDTGIANQCNNDHGLSFDGKWIAASSGPTGGGSQIYVLPAAGGAARLVTSNAPSYWHGWSPDGKTLVYCAKRNGNYDVYSIPAEGGVEKRLTQAEGLDDGCEYTVDGSKIYFHSERVGGVPKIFRMNPDGSDQEQITFDEDYADWFPHPSPDGKWIVLVSFDKSVKGHPANKNVVLRLMPLAGGKPKIIATLFGGQGTINVPSWSPDSTRIAFVSYRNILAPSKAN